MEQMIIDDIIEELRKAERKFPRYPIDPCHAASIVAEEAGELVKAALEFNYEDGLKGCMRFEAIQVAASAIRFLLHYKVLEKSQSKQVDIYNPELYHKDLL